MTAQTPTVSDRDGEQCVCGDVLQPCITCAQPRCARCDPYRSEDCLRELARLDAAVGAGQALR